MTKLISLGLLTVVSAVTFASSTLATFSDPSAGHGQPLFVFNTNTNMLSGSWTGTGLNVKLPGVTGGEVQNAKFEMSPVQLVQVPGSGIFTGGQGKVRFYTDDINQPFFVVDFAGATLFSPLSFGASEFNGSTVNFSGPGVPSGLTQEQFSFALANPTVQGANLTYTASFTSSAVPEPATMTALALGAAAMLRRRKKA